jgi:hypothetical protein
MVLNYLASQSYESDVDSLHRACVGELCITIITEKPYFCSQFWDFQSMICGAAALGPAPWQQWLGNKKGRDKV